ncbi:MAG: TatD family deoxyribonuclease [Proteobacteria bacterium]|nr:TatD family deoxyribonuclease [Pseudomonadota bacterium]NBY19588.1 TatD family deoxyribonuclease [bacterium]
MSDDEVMKSPSWIDAHCHLASDKFKDDLSQVLERSQQVGVTGWVQGGVDPVDWDRQKELKILWGKRFITSFGLHPWWVATASASVLNQGFKQLEESLPQSDALGELGLDFGQKHDFNRPQQADAFKRQLELAKRYPKPLILHIVKAHPEALDILKSMGPFPKGGIVHSFSGSYEIAQDYSKLGLLISVGGAITQDGYFGLKKAIPLLSLPQIVVETDSPDQVPKLKEAGERNEPKHLVGIAETIARLKGVTTQDVLDQSTRNLEKLFGLI